MSLDQPTSPRGFYLAPLRELLRGARRRSVPDSVNLFHYLGALTLVVFCLQIVTGVLLLIYYRPSATAAYYSTAVIVDDVRLGWLVRSLHHWGTDLLLALVLLHLVRVYFSRAYRPPRQLSWVVGIVVLVLLVGSGFTGTLLPWDQYAYWYVDSARQTVAAIPVLGNLLLGLFWGGWDLGEEVLLRFYAFHVGVLPWLIVSLLALHLLMVARFGTTDAEPGGAATRVPLYPDFLLNLSLCVLLVSGGLLSLAVFFPPALGTVADPLTPLAHAAPRWYLLSVRELLRGLPGGTAALSVVALFVALFLVPRLDYRPRPHRWGVLLQRLLGAAFIAGWLALSLRGALR